MKSPLASTLLMGFVAVVSAAFAAYFYPWPKVVVQTDMVGEPLFEEYDYNNVRYVEIVDFDRDNNELKRIKFRRSGEKWVFPEKSNYEVTATQAIADLVNSLNARTVLEVMSDQQQEHVDYGVVDPEDYEKVTGYAGLGTKIVLANRNNEEIASLVVGKGRKNDGGNLKRFVRRPGQPQVFSIEYNANLLQTEFPRWVSANLFNLQTPQNVGGNRPLKVMLDNYRIDPEKITDAKRQPLYSAVIDLSQPGRATIPDAMVLDEESGELKSRELNDRNRAELNSVGRFLGNIAFADVTPKASDLAKNLRLPKDEYDLAGLEKFGFRKVGMNEGAYEIDAARGSVGLLTRNGVEMTLYIGAPNGNLSVYTGRPERYVMLTARVDESAFEMPEKPETEDEQSAEYKAYLRALEDREKEIKKSRDVAKALNREFSKWFYIVEETICDGLLPDIDWDAKMPAPPARAGN